MSRQSIRSRCFAGVAALSAVGASMAVNGVRFEPLVEPPRSVGLRSVDRVDPDARLKQRSSEAISLSNDPYSHFVRLAGLYPDADGVSMGVERRSLSLDASWQGLRAGTIVTDGVNGRDSAIDDAMRLEVGFVNVTLEVDAVIDAPRWGNRGRQ